MNSETVEIEAKFYIQNPEPFKENLIRQGAKLVSERILERNWRFDTPSRTLTSKGEVLRIREDRRFRLTYKRPISGTLERTEIEVEVQDSTKTRLLLEALGFEVFYLYEKFRETFKLDDVEIVLDEVPYGCFVEIEGPSTRTIYDIAETLGLSWDRRVTSTYLGLFEHLRKKLKLPFPHATFEAFAGISEISPEDLNLQDAFEIDPSRK
jgi:adenylate cyclase class 2